MEDRIKELEEQVESLQNNLGEAMRIQTEIIKILNRHVKITDTISNTEEKMIAFIAELTGTTDVLK